MAGAKVIQELKNIIPFLLSKFKSSKVENVEKLLLIGNVKFFNLINQLSIEEFYNYRTKEGLTFLHIIILGLFYNCNNEKQDIGLQDDDVVGLRDNLEKLVDSFLSVLNNLFSAYDTNDSHGQEFFVEKVEELLNLISDKILKNLNQEQYRNIFDRFVACENREGFSAASFMIQAYKNDKVKFYNILKYFLVNFSNFKLDKRGRNSLHYLLSICSEDEQDRFLSEIVKPIIKKDSSILFKTDKDGCNVLHYAFSRGYELNKISEYLITNYPNLLKQVDKNGNSPLHTMAMVYPFYMWKVSLSINCVKDSRKFMKINKQVNGFVNRLDCEIKTIEVALSEFDDQCESKCIEVMKAVRSIINKLANTSKDLSSDKYIDEELDNRREFLQKKCEQLKMFCEKLERVLITLLLPKEIDKKGLFDEIKEDYKIIRQYDNRNLNLSYFKAKLAEMKKSKDKALKKLEEYKYLQNFALSKLKLEDLMMENKDGVSLYSIFCNYRDAKGRLLQKYLPNSEERARFNNSMVKFLRSKKGVKYKSELIVELFKFYNESPTLTLHKGHDEFLKFINDNDFKNTVIAWLLDENSEFYKGIIDNLTLETLNQSINNLQNCLYEKDQLLYEIKEYQIYQVFIISFLFLFSIVPILLSTIKKDVQIVGFDFGAERHIFFGMLSAMMFLTISCIVIQFFQLEMCWINCKKDELEDEIQNLKETEISFIQQDNNEYEDEVQNSRESRVLNDSISKALSMEKNIGI